MQIQTILKNFGLNDKEVAVYLTLIELGSAPVREISTKSKVNRGTTYDILKSLMEQGLATYFNKQSHQYFTAEPPEKLVTALEHRKQEIDSVKNQIQENLPTLQSAFNRGGGQPVMKLYEGVKGIRQIFEDVLISVSTSKDKQYWIYSSATVKERKLVYAAMPDFNKKRLTKKIKVQTISLGLGGELVGLDQRKWLNSKDANLNATHQIIYAGKVAHISLDDAENPVGVVIENEAIFETQKIIFSNLWQNL